MARRWRPGENMLAWAHRINRDRLRRWNGRSAEYRSARTGSKTPVRVVPGALETGALNSPGTADVLGDAFVFFLGADYGVQPERGDIVRVDWRSPGGASPRYVHYQVVMDGDRADFQLVSSRSSYQVNSVVCAAPESW